MVYCEFDYMLSSGGGWHHTRQRLPECTEAAAKAWVNRQFGSNATCCGIKGLREIQ